MMPLTVVVQDFLNYFEDNVLLWPNLDITTLMTTPGQRRY
jgi:hypothetical protein